MDFLLLLPILICGVGFFMLFKLRFFFFKHPLKIARSFGGALKRKNSFSALTLALSGTLGVGNIFGVALGIIVGGAGTLFWLLVSAFISAVIKFCEVALSADMSSDGYGMIGVIEKTFGKRGGVFSAAYASLCLILSLVMGGMLQAGSIGSMLCEVVGSERFLVASFLLILVSLAVSGGAEKIQKATSKILPVTTIIYIFMCFFAIFSNFSRFGEVVRLIFSSAFSIRSVGGGVGSFMLLRAMREGFVGGMLSNEAGAGTSSMGHARCNETTPCERGLFGAFEVLFDTAFVCMLTGFAIMLCVPDVTKYNSAMTLVSDAMVGVFGRGAILPLAISVFFFAFSTIICWYYYGNLARGYLFAKRGERVFLVLFLLAVVLGVFSRDIVSARLADTVLFSMTLPTLFCIIKSSDRIVSLSEREGFIKIKADECAKEAHRRRKQALPKNQTRKGTR